MACTAPARVHRLVAQGRQRRSKVVVQCWRIWWSSKDEARHSGEKSRCCSTTVGNSPSKPWSSSSRLLMSQRRRHSPCVVTAGETWCHVSSTVSMQTSTASWWGCLCWLHCQLVGCCSPEFCCPPGSSPCLESPRTAMSEKSLLLAHCSVPAVVLCVVPSISCRMISNVRFQRSRKRFVLWYWSCKDLMLMVFRQSWMCGKSSLTFCLSRLMSRARHLRPKE